MPVALVDWPEIDSTNHWGLSETPVLIFAVDAGFHSKQDPQKGPATA